MTEALYEEVHKRFFVGADGQLRHRKNNEVVGTRRADGYMVVKINKVLYLVHRVVWLYYTGVWPEEILDHIDRDRSNNRFENLREVTHQQNHVNVAPPRNNTSGYVGVTWNAKNQKWVARCAKRHLGCFATKEEAAAAVAAEQTRILSAQL